jgi:4'-phosphopantetheinyl transferase
VRSLDCAWVAGAASSPLGDDEVQLWRAPLIVPAETRSRLARHLSVDEQVRADRFRFDRDRDRFIAAHGWLREILAVRLNLDARAVRFVAEATGKPALDGGGVAFNLSHAGDLALIAMSQRPVGVDLEPVRDGMGLQEVADRYFSAGERETLAALVGPARDRLFFALWTLREAYVKATGEGVAGLERIAIDLVDGEPTRIRALDESRWSVYRLDIRAGYVGALVVDGAPASVRCLTAG